MESIIFLSDTLEAIGAIAVAFMVIRVHHRVWQEHKIDAKVFIEMKKERVLGTAGITLMLLGYIMKIYIHFMPI